MGSPSQQTGPEQRADEGAQDDGDAIPDRDERQRVAGAMERVCSGPDGPSDQSRDRARASQIRGRSLAQGPNQGSERDDRKKRYANQAGPPLHSKDHRAPARGVPDRKRNKPCANERSEGEKEQS